ncbi:capping complex subunit for YIEGIA [Paenibacillus xerothermodurans]|uniref:Uncharacterized protein n=1 Tax=Paenibacillus xerothermodurans TaxID=1977292 RepID=A0A2W1P2K9_PAEXE|nr:hypothetical protein [Paenibacillus xerothermodurans]PZE21962.1 hypothetical protein CBW46_006070 [Paenibacillus xerothermodurans]
MGRIMAIVAFDSNQVAGGEPIFITKDKSEQQKVAFLLEKILDAAAHDLENGVMILVDHSDSDK